MVHWYPTISIFCQINSACETGKRMRCTFDFISEMRQDMEGATLSKYSLRQGIYFHHVLSQNISKLQLHYIPSPVLTILGKWTHPCLVSRCLKIGIQATQYPLSQPKNTFWDRDNGYGVGSFFISETRLDGEGRLSDNSWDRTRIWQLWFIFTMRRDGAGGLHFPRILELA